MFSGKQEIEDSFILESLANDKRWNQGSKWRFNLNLAKRIAWRNQRDVLDRAIGIIENRQKSILK